MPAARSPMPRDHVLQYLEEMLAELAAMAEGVGERRIATSLRLLAIEAAQAVAEPAD